LQLSLPSLQPDPWTHHFVINSSAIIHTAEQTQAEETICKPTD